MTAREKGESARAEPPENTDGERHSRASVPLPADRPVAVGRFEWERRFRDTPITWTAKLVGLTLATYANGNGEGAHPGEQRLVAATSLGERAVRDGLKRLRELGFLERVNSGSRCGLRGYADVYRLVLPTVEPPAPHAGGRAEPPAPDAAGSGEPPAPHDEPPAPHDRTTGTTCRPPVQSTGTRDQNKGRARDGSLPPTTLELASYSPEFEKAWTAYGRKGTKRAAQREWTKAVKRADVDKILQAIDDYVAGTPEIRYRKHFERWLRDDGWESAATTGIGTIGPSGLPRGPGWEQSPWTSLPWNN